MTDNSNINTRQGEVEEGSTDEEVKNWNICYWINHGGHMCGFVVPV